jgi:phosphotransferase system enzyme I (PtsI)
MFEIPSACICAREILEEAEFGSVGTNDLTQYLFAVDRDNELVADDYNTDRPAFWALMSSVVRAAAEARRPLSVCGEIAAYPPHVLRLMDLGVTSVSVSPRLIPDVRRAAASRITSASGEFI